MLNVFKFTVWYLTVQMIVLYNYTVFYRIANLIEEFEALIIHEYLINWVQKNLLILCAF